MLSQQRIRQDVAGLLFVNHGLVLEFHSFLITGSARLDVYRRGGDSLMGRYHYWRLHPFTLDEIPPGISPKEAGFDRHCVWNIPGTERRRYWKPSLMHDGKVINHGEEKYGSTVIADYLIDFIKTNKDKPFLAYYPMNLPHNPFDPTPRSKNRKSKNAKRNFIDMVAYMDHCVGRIEDTLIELGLRENTLMIFTADNGTNSSLTLDFFGTQRRGGKGYSHHDHITCSGGHGELYSDGRVQCHEKGFCP